MVEELRRLGVQDVIVCPGSRNTPLIAALIQSSALRITQVVDERAAAYFALGCAKNLLPAVVVTTSGTAVMNLLPAITEARQSGVPLIVLSADRPQELRDCGANQAIDQLGPLQPVVKWQHDLPAPDDRLPARLALTAVDQAVRAATTGFPGPVQINCAFREPLAPIKQPWDFSCLDGTEKWREGDLPFIEDIDCTPTFDPAGISRMIEDSERGLIVVGNTIEGNAVARLAEKLNWPVLADVASGIRTGNGPGQLIHHADWVVDLPAEGTRPDLVLQFGARLTSRKIQEWLDGLDCRRVMVDPSDYRMNPGHATLMRIVAPVEIVAGRISESVSDAPSTNPSIEWLPGWREMDERVASVFREIIDDDPSLTEAFVARQVAESGCLLFAGNSLPIRHLNQFATGDSPNGRVMTNRGASGIDGVLATACGVAHAEDEPLVLLIGDLSLLHDLNSLHLVKSSRGKIIIVLINNGGGGIFNQLPVAEFPEVMTPLCDASHELEFCGFAGEFGLTSWRCSTKEEFIGNWKMAQEAGESCLVEVVCNREDHGELLRVIDDRIRDGR